jgi:hypothetical protein
MSIPHLTPTQLRQAAAILERIAELQNELNQIQGGKPEFVPQPVAPAAIEDNGGVPGRKRRKMSASGLARIRAAQKARWARVHAAQGK